MTNEKRAEKAGPELADLEKSPTYQDGVATIVASGVDDAGFQRRLSKRQIMMMTFGAGSHTYESRCEYED